MGITFSHGDVAEWTHGTYNNFLRRLATAIGIDLDQMKGWVSEELLTAVAHGERTVKSISAEMGQRPWTEVQDDIKPLLTAQKSIAPTKCRGVARRLRELVQDWLEDAEHDYLGTFDKLNALQLADALDEAAGKGEIFYIDSDGPKRPARRQRPIRLEVLLPAADRAWAEQEAQTKGLPVGAYVRSLVLGALSRRYTAPPPPENEPLVRPPLQLDLSVADRDAIQDKVRDTEYPSAAAFVRGIVRWVREAPTRTTHFRRLLAENRPPNQSLDTWVVTGKMSAEDAARLRTLLATATGVLIVGRSGSGKTVLLEALLHAAADQSTVAYLNVHLPRYAPPDWTTVALPWTGNRAAVYAAVTAALPPLQGREVWGIDELGTVHMELTALLRLAETTVIGTMQWATPAEAYQRLAEQVRRWAARSQQQEDWLALCADVTRLFPWCVWLEDVGTEDVHFTRVVLREMAPNQPPAPPHQPLAAESVSLWQRVQAAGAFQEV